MTGSPALPRRSVVGPGRGRDQGIRSRGGAGGPRRRLERDRGELRRRAGGQIQRRGRRVGSGVALPGCRAAEQGGPPGPGGDLVAGSEPGRGGQGHRQTRHRCQACWSRWTWPTCPAGGGPPDGGGGPGGGVAGRGPRRWRGSWPWALPVRPRTPGPGFALVSSLADSLDLPVRSMGMSDDLEVALSEGSTMLRLGRALFGDRAPGRAGRPGPARHRSGPES